MGVQGSVASTILWIGDATEVQRDLLAGVLAYTHRHGLAWTVRGAISQFPALLSRPAGAGSTTDIVIAHRGIPESLKGMDLVRCSPSDDGVCLCRVWFDDEALGRQAAEYLIGCGCRQGAIFVGKAEAHPAYRLTREGSFARRFLELGGHCELLDTPRDRGLEAALAWRRDRLAAMPRPVAVFTYQDREATYVAEDLRRAGLRIGEDAALLSCEDSPAAVGFDPPLSSVRMSWRLLGEAAARQAHSLVTGGACERLVLVQPQGVAVRVSTACRHDPLVERAERLIRRVLPRGLRVAHLARRLGVSEVTLGRRYRQTFGIDTCGRIRWHRLMAAQAALAEVDGASVAAIAKRGGWWSRQHFTTDFRRCFGTTPARFRAGVAPGP